MACMSCECDKKRKNLIEIAPYVPADLQMKSTTKYVDNTYHIIEKDVKFCFSLIWDLESGMTFLLFIEINSICHNLPSLWALWAQSIDYNDLCGSLTILKLNCILLTLIFSNDFNSLSLWVVDEWCMQFPYEFFGDWNSVWCKFIQLFKDNIKNECRWIMMSNAHMHISHCTSIMNILCLNNNNQFFLSRICFLDL